jgi:hypothetical protein
VIQGFSDIFKEKIKPSELTKKSLLNAKMRPICAHFMFYFNFFS